MKSLLSAMIIAALALMAGCVAVPTRHGLVVEPVVPTVHVGVGYGYGPYYRPYH